MSDEKYGLADYLADRYHLSNSVTEFERLAADWVNGPLGEDFIAFAIDGMEEFGDNVFKSLVDYVEMQRYSWKKVSYEVDARNNADVLAAIKPIPTKPEE